MDQLDQPPATRETNIRAGWCDERAVPTSVEISARHSQAAAGGGGLLDVWGWGAFGKGDRPSWFVYSPHPARGPANARRWFFRPGRFSFTEALVGLKPSCLSCKSNPHKGAVEASCTVYDRFVSGLHYAGAKTCMRRVCKHSCTRDSRTLTHRASFCLDRIEVIVFGALLPSCLIYTMSKASQPLSSRQPHLTAARA